LAIAAAAGAIAGDGSPLAFEAPAGGHSAPQAVTTATIGEGTVIASMDGQPPILVGYDPRSRDRAPAHFGAAAARFTGAPLIIASVCSTAHDHEHAEDLAPQAHEELEELKTELQIDADVRELRGTSPPRALHEAAEAEGAALLVVGSTHRGSVGRLLPGSTAERLMHGAPCSIAVVPQGWEERGKLNPLGVAYTRTDEGREALRAAHALARKAAATLRVLTVVKPTSGVFANTETSKPGRAGTDVEDVEGAHELDLEQDVRVALADAGGGDIDVEVDAFVDDPADALIRVSANLDLLICGSRGYGPVRAVLLGGVSRRVASEAHCPVIVLPRGVKAPLHALAAAPGTIAAG
jgi:nucleotide-binding universal stress UspA family protein